MASITVRNLDEGLKQRLRVRAATNGRSMEQEVREILNAALDEEAARIEEALLDPEKNLAEVIHDLFAPLGGVDLELPPREPIPEPPTFD